MSFFKKYFGDQYRKYSYSQSGEDLIVDFLRKRIGLKKSFNYLDIGAFHPSRFSNTRYFYKKGFNGVCVEPNPDACHYFKSKRSRDIVLNCGVGKIKSISDFYVISGGTLSTFSKEEAERCVNNRVFGQAKIEKIVKIPILPVMEIIQSNFKEAPNFVSIDVEGLDYEVVKGIDFTRVRPDIFCVETTNFDDSSQEYKCNDILEHFAASDYMVYADTFINTIFIAKEKWLLRK